MEESSNLLIALNFVHEYYLPLQQIPGCTYKTIYPSSWEICHFNVKCSISDYSSATLADWF